MNVIDASVAVKWFVAEPGHSEALALLEAGTRFLAPDTLFPEVANALRRKLRRRELSELQLRDAIAALPSYLDGIVPSEELIVAAVDFSLKLDHSVYDCLYLTTALIKSHVLISADQVFVDKCHGAGLGRYVVSLYAWQDVHHRVAANETVIRGILDLHARFEKTLESVTDLVSRPLGPGRLRITHSENLKSAFDSPTYIGLRSAITRLDRKERSELLALGWLGEGYSGGDWREVLQRALDYLTDDPETHVDYLISKLIHVEAGLMQRETPRVDSAPDAQSKA